MTAQKLPPVPQNIAPFVDVLGIDGTVEFLLEFGGAEVWYPSGKNSASELVQVLGAEKALALADRADALKARIPLAKPWLAKVLHAKGLSQARIARKLHASDVTIRKYLGETSASSATQPSLL